MNNISKIRQSNFDLHFFRTENCLSARSVFNRPCCSKCLPIAEYLCTLMRWFNCYSVLHYIFLSTNMVFYLYCTCYTFVLDKCDDIFVSTTSVISDLSNICLLAKYSQMHDFIQYDIICVAQITFKFVNQALIVDHWGILLFLSEDFGS